MFKVLIADKLSTEAEKIFTDNGLKVKTKTGLKEDELIQELNDCDALVVRLSLIHISEPTRPY